MSRNRVIGHGNKIPWHLPEDFAWFKQMTTGNVIVMGRKTFESIGRPLPNRETIILSRSHFEFPGTQTISSLDQLDPASESREIFICGGAEIYKLALPKCSDLYLTVVNQEVEGDTFLQEFEADFEKISVIQQTPKFDIIHFRNHHLVD